MSRHGADSLAALGGIGEPEKGFSQKYGEMRGPVSERITGDVDDGGHGGQEEGRRGQAIGALGEAATLLQIFRLYCGTGLLAYPYAVRCGGMLGALVSILIIGFLIISFYRFSDYHPLVICSIDTCDTAMWGTRWVVLV